MAIDQCIAQILIVPLPNLSSELGQFGNLWLFGIHTHTPHRLEELFYKAGVDIILEAHEHSYERLWPVFNGNVSAKNYLDPKAPVHIISGTAGCKEGVDPMLGPRGMYISERDEFQEIFTVCRPVVCIPFLVSDSTWVWEAGSCECYSCVLGTSS